MEEIYCIDTSSLMELDRTYPMSRFQLVWQRVEDLIEVGRLIAPHEVLNELKQGDDALLRWAKTKSGMFKPLDSEQAKAVSYILSQCPALIDSMKDTPQADPFIIALAQVGTAKTGGPLFKVRHVVVTQEGRNNPNKIPQVCKRSGIESVNLLGLFERENWQF
jgi:hypothetical protein